MKTIRDLSNSIPAPGRLLGGTILDLDSEIYFGLLKQDPFDRVSHELLSDVLLLMDHGGDHSVVIPGWFKVNLWTTKHDPRRRQSDAPEHLMQFRRTLLPRRPVHGIVTCLRSFQVSDEVWHDYIWFQSEADAVAFGLGIK